LYCRLPRDHPSLGGGGTGAALSARPAAAAGARARPRRAGCCCRANSPRPAGHRQVWDGGREPSLPATSGRCTCAAAAGGILRFWAVGSAFGGEWDGDDIKLHPGFDVRQLVALYHHLCAYPPIFRFQQLGGGDVPTCSIRERSDAASIYCAQSVFFGAIFAFLNCSRPSS
jgi:hypothetical protein